MVSFLLLYFLKVEKKDEGEEGDLFPLSRLSAKTVVLLWEAMTWKIPAHSHN